LREEGLKGVAGPKVSTARFRRRWAKNFFSFP
jgi:hypothetical protein